MLLVADIGNTSTTIGIYKDKELLNTWTLASDKKRSTDEYGVLISGFINLLKVECKITNAVISSVVLEITEKFESALKKYFNINSIVLSHKTNHGLNILLNKPKEVGADRLANAYAAFKLYKTPAIVIDFGTATTFDIIDSNANFLGGLIAPGLALQAKSLSNFTSKLPNIKLEDVKQAIGKNTIEAMLSGVVLGHAAMIDGMIERSEKELGEKATLIATGGYSSIILNHLKRPFDYLNKDLTLEGLRLIFERENLYTK